VRSSAGIQIVVLDFDQPDGSIAFRQLAEFASVSRASAFPGHGLDIYRSVLCNQSVRYLFDAFEAVMRQCSASNVDCRYVSPRWKETVGAFSSCAKTAITMLSPNAAACIETAHASHCALDHCPHERSGLRTKCHTSRFVLFDGLMGLPNGSAARGCR